MSSPVISLTVVPGPEDGYDQTALRVEFGPGIFWHVELPQPVIEEIIRTCDNYFISMNADGTAEIHGEFVGALPMAFGDSDRDTMGAMLEDYLDCAIDADRDPKNQYLQQMHELLEHLLDKVREAITSR